MSLWAELGESVKNSNVESTIKILQKCISLHGATMVDHFKVSMFDKIPSPVSPQFERYPQLVTHLTEAITQAGESLHPDSTVRAAVLRDWAQFSVDSLRFFALRRAISERLTDSQFFSFSRMRQLQLLCTMLEDQARLASMQRKAPVAGDALDMLLDGTQTLTGSYQTHWQGQQVNGDGFELALRYIMYLMEKDGQTGFGELPETGVNPYNLGPVTELLVLPQMMDSLAVAWGFYLFRQWTCHYDTEDFMLLSPPSTEHYKLEEASFYRQEMFLDEVVDQACRKKLYSEIDERRALTELANMLVDTSLEHLQRLDGKYLKSVLLTQTSHDIAVEDALRRLFETNASTLFVGQGSSRTRLANLLQGWKLVRLIAGAWQIRTWGKFEQRGGNYEVLCPVLRSRDLAVKLTETGLMEAVDADRVVKLLTFDRKRRHDEIWQQPLVPLNDEVCMLMPTIATSASPLVFVESHLLASGYAFDKRGTKFEKKLRAALATAKLMVAPDAFTFRASDGRSCEVDIFALIGDYVIIGDAKCIKFPADPNQRRNAWDALKEGVEQVERRCRLLQTDWARYRSSAGIKLPNTPPSAEKVIPIVATNIFTFSGRCERGVYICDLPALFRYFAPDDPLPFAHSHIKEGVTKVREADPDAEELIRYLSDPPQMRRVLQRLTMQTQTFPQLTDASTGFGYPLVSPLSARL